MSEAEPTGNVKTPPTAATEAPVAPQRSAIPSLRTMPQVHLARSLLIFLAAIYALAAGILCVLLFLSARSDGWPLAQAWAAPALGLVAALMVPGLLFAGAKFLEAHHRQHLELLAQMQRSLEQMRADLNLLQSEAAHTDSILQNIGLAEAAALSGGSLGPTDAAGPDKMIFRQMLDLLEQLRDVGMMTEAQRQLWAERVRTERQTRLTEAIHRHLEAGQWPQAGQFLEELRRTLPDDPLVGQLAAELNQARSRQLQSEVEETRNHLRQLMSINAWDQVEQMAGALARRHPHEPAVRELMATVRQEHEVWQRDELHRLRVEFRDAADHRRWGQACVIAQQILDRYPYAKTAKKIREELVTLRRNADIEQRQELETQFKDLLQRQRQTEAIAIAERILESFPESKAAAELQRMLPRLREMAQQEKERGGQAAGQKIM